jgi:predicted nucleic-acid-binding Zn-ribbon protein
MSCSHVFNKNWEFGPIIVEPGNTIAKHWFYRKCVKCGYVELFSTSKINSMVNDLDSNKLVNIFAQDEKFSVTEKIQLFPRINLEEFR